ncbi:FkbM family methyltransferase [Oceanibaculum pacificum]|uniref:Methyltransferase FkbM domain-containing protein n=1 Tax=Oceanibaculum pacificum TaxID=580166 RepID=A0A154W355_9PROT|nr:FkbM family methyltransferase [Oceanibaculum pacificum]KZD07958.1 hypothetical protein AUP43_09190 [Oceanibaculum pacificum]
MFRRLKRLIGHPGFRAEPFAMTWRSAAWALHVARGASPVFPLTAAGGEKMRVPSDLRYTSVSCYVLRDWCEPELRHLDRLVRPGSVFIDIGANIGLFTLKAARLTGPRGTVIAVEPGTEAADRLTANVGLNDYAQVRIVREALSDSNGEAVLHHVPLGNDPQAYSLIGSAMATEGETVKTETLDSLVERLGLTAVDCIKMDVEGAEPMVIAGAAGTLERFHPMVIFEINTTLVKTGTEGAGPNDAAWRALQAHGYGFRRFRDGRLVEVAEVGSEFGNLVAVHPNGPAPVPDSDR